MENKHTEGWVQMKESDIMRQVQISMSAQGYRLFRNNVGDGWVGDVTRASVPCNVHMNPGDVLVRNARPLHSGLVKGSSDLIGWNPQGLFTAVEVKTKIGRVSEEQQTFLDAVKLAGGVAMIFRG